MDWLRKRSRKRSNPAESSSAFPPWKVFTREELRSITNDFSEENCLVGDPNTGGIYRGLLPDGSIVAVKRLRWSSFQMEERFYSEFGRVVTLSHPNVVAVKGGLYDGRDRYVVYEFIGNGSLDRWLHDVPTGGRSLDWAMRMKVATTLAQGIAFLHDKMKPEVVRVDIRAINVFLDEDFGAHLMGAGFVPWDAIDQSAVMAGSHVHQAPEFVFKTKLSTECDVYSFGVLLLEIISGRRPATPQAGGFGRWENIFDWAAPLAEAHRYLEILDPHISSSSQVPKVVAIQDVLLLAYSCTQNVPSDRPSMSDVVHQLQQLAT